MSSEATNLKYLSRKLLGTELPWECAREAGFAEETKRLELIAREMADMFDPSSTDSDFREPEALLRRDYESFLRELTRLKMDGTANPGILSRGQEILGQMLEYARDAVELYEKQLDPDDKVTKAMGGVEAAGRFYELYIERKNTVEAIQTLMAGLEDITTDLERQPPGQGRG